MGELLLAQDAIDRAGQRVHERLEATLEGVGLLVARGDVAHHDAGKAQAARHLGSGDADAVTRALLERQPVLLEGRDDALEIVGDARARHEQDPGELVEGDPVMALQQVVQEVVGTVGGCDSRIRLRHRARTGDPMPKNILVVYLAYISVTASAETNAR